jgi:hypothetical protein
MPEERRDSVAELIMEFHDERSMVAGLVGIGISTEAIHGAIDSCIAAAREVHVQPNLLAFFLAGLSVGWQARENTTLPTIVVVQEEDGTTVCGDHGGGFRVHRKRQHG